MGEPGKRNAVLDWLFGAPLPSAERARLRARRRGWLFRTRQTLLLVVVVLMVLGIFEWDHRLPVIGHWLARDWWALAIILAVLVALEYALGWYERRRDARLRPWQGSAARR